jgi:hypothetical protein
LLFAPNYFVLKLWRMERPCDTRKSIIADFFRMQNSAGLHLLLFPESLRKPKLPFHLLPSGSTFQRTLCSG